MPIAEQFSAPYDLQEEALDALEIARDTGAIKIGTNGTTKAAERGRAKLVLIAEDVQPQEIVMHIPELCTEKRIPFLFIDKQDKIGPAAGLEVGTAAAAIIDPGLNNEPLKSVLHKLRPLLSFESKTEIKTNNNQIKDDLVPTPYTLWQFPKTDVFSYFYYFTDDRYTEKDSKFRLLDDQLTLMGRNRTGLEVGIFDRDRMREKIWQILIEGLDIDNYPTLVVAEGPLGIEEIDQNTESFSPNEVDYAKIENGVISDHILEDSDEVRDFLNTLFDASRDNEIVSQMRKKKIAESLAIGKEEVQGILSITGGI